MSKLWPLHFRNYMGISVLAVCALSGCVKFTSSDRLQTPTAVEQKNSTERGPTPEEIVQDPDRFGKDVYWKNSCEVLKVQFNENTMQAENVQQNLTIERHYQRVIRKNCEGVVQSDAIETVASPRQDFELKIPGIKKAQSFFIYNDETCAHKLGTLEGADSFLGGLFLPVTSDGKSKLLVKGDMADALLTFHMREGMNNVYVQYFYDCSPGNVIGNIHTTIGQANCKSAKSSLIVQYPVNVTYVKKDFDGVKEVIPTEAECAAKTNSGTP